LRQKGIQAYNLDGAFKTYQSVYNPSDFMAMDETDDAGKMIIETPQKTEPLSINFNPTLVVDASGLQCPGPIVKTFKSLEKMNDGEILEISATDPGFKKDVKTWVEKTNNTLIDLKEENNRFTAKILKGNQMPKKSVETKTNLEDSTIVVFSEDLDKAIAAFIIAQGAASMGKKVSLFFTFWGLNILRKPKKVKVKKSFIERMFGSMMPRGTKKLPISKMNMLGMGPKMIKSIMKKKNVDALEEMIRSAMDLGVKITACAMSMDIMGIKKEELIDGVEIAGVATYLGDTTTSNHNLFI
jgi:peroxiredoxin family protein/TusA-related sulfurtransferase